MQVKREDKSENEVVLTISGDLVEIGPLKEHVLTEHFADKVKIPGFRAGKAPSHLIEKNVNQNEFQAQLIEELINDLFSKAVNQEKLRTVEQPQVQIKKFVPYTQIEFEATVAVLGKVTIPDYKKMTVARPKVKNVTEEDIEKVLDNLKSQVSEKKDVNRAAKNGDQLYIDFKGTDSEGKPVSGADGKNYPLVLGSKAFIPGFEENLIGLKPGESKTFTLKFPKDYSLKALASKDVTFVVDILKIQEIVTDVLDDTFATKVGPFKSLKELKDDIKKQLKFEKENEAERDYESEVLKQITEKSKLTLPEILINDEVERALTNLSRNLNYRGQTLQEFLDLEGMDREEYIDKIIKPEVTEKLKASIVLSEISEAEKMNLTQEEIDVQIMQLKAQYNDPQSQEELNKPETRRDIASRLLAEKTIKKIISYIDKNRTK